MEPENNQSYRNLLYELDPHARELFRSLEKNKRRLIQAKFAGMFNTVYFAHNISNFIAFFNLLHPNGALDLELNRALLN